MDNELECLRRLAAEVRKVLNESLSSGFSLKVDLHPLSEKMVDWEQNYKEG